VWVGGARHKVVLPAPLLRQGCQTHNGPLRRTTVQQLLPVQLLGRRMPQLPWLLLLHQWRLRAAVMAGHGCSSYISKGVVHES